MNDMRNLSGLDKAAILFQVLGESLALSMFQNISEADIMRIRIRAKELSNLPLSLKKNIVEEYYFRMMSKQHQNSQNTNSRYLVFL